MSELPPCYVVSWEVRTIISLSTTTKASKSTIKPEQATKPQTQTRERGKIVIYQEYFRRLLAYPKGLRNQIILELPTLQAFRTGEVGTLQSEWVDVENGDLQVLDSKKGVKFTVPLDSTFAKHYLQYVEETGITHGVLIRGRKHTGKGLSVTHVERIWFNECAAAGIPPMSPRMGRAYFAAKWHFIEKKSLYGLMTVLRHSNLRVTEQYIEKLVDYEAVKTEFRQGQFSPLSLSPCQRSMNCPLAAPECRCRMFQPKLEATIQ